MRVAGTIGTGVPPWYVSATHAYHGLIHAVLQEDGEGVDRVRRKGEG